MGNKKRVLLACEFSGTFQNIFDKAGFDAWSCDLKAPINSNKHLRGNVLNYIKDDWDLMVAFPPCTFLSYVGAKNWSNPERVMYRIKAAKFFMQLYSCDINKVCIENPRGIMNKIFRQPDQEVHPYYFGEPIMKRTGFWLKGLPKLKFNLGGDLFNQDTSTMKPKVGHIDKFMGGDVRRTISFNSFAQAMVNQWGEII